MKNIFLSFCALLIPYFSIAQCADMGLYAFSKGGSDSNYVLHYNPITEAFDIVIQLDGIFSMYPTDATIDAYNGRLFLCEYVNKKYRLVIVDLNTKTVTRAANRVDMIAEMEYDMFENKLVIRDPQQEVLLSYDIANDSFNEICTVPYGWTSYHSSVYRPIEQHYVYSVFVGTGSLNMYTVDISKKQIINIYNHTYDKHFNFPIFQTFDINTEKIIGIYNNITPDTLTKIVSIDNMSGDMNDISDVNLSYQHTRYLDRAVFDARANTYYFPFLSPDPWFLEANIEVIDINTGNILKTIKSQYSYCLHTFHGAYNPISKLRPDSTLITTYGKSYQWYYNGTKIEGAIAQTYKPRLPGFYSAEVVFSCGRKATSNEVYADVHEIVNSPLEDGEVRVYNNVVAGNDDATVVFHNPNKEEHTLLIYNSLGQLVQQQHKITTNFVNIRGASFASGIYYFRLFKAGKNAGQGKLLVP